MTRVRLLLGRAGTATLLVAAAQALAAWAGTGSIASAPASPVDVMGLTAPRLGALLEGATAGGGQLVRPAMVVGAYWLGAPLLALIWIRATVVAAPLRTHAAIAGTRYWTALALGAAAAVASAFLAGCTAGVVWTLDALTTHVSNATLWLLTATAAAAIASLALLVASTLDLTRAAIAVRQLGLGEAFRCGVHAVRPGLLVHRLTSAVLCIALTVVGDALARIAMAPGLELLAPASVQAAAFAAVLARGHFLVAAAEAVARKPRPANHGTLSPR